MRTQYILNIHMYTSYTTHLPLQVQGGKGALHVAVAGARQQLAVQRRELVRVHGAVACVGGGGWWRGPCVHEGAFDPVCVFVGVVCVFVCVCA